MAVRPEFWDTIRSRYGTTDREIAAALGVSANHVYRVRKGQRRPGNLFIQGVRRALPGWSLDFFFPVDAPSQAEVA